MSILLARHGETDWNVERRIQGNTDIPLNENGIRQAHSLSSYLDRLFHAEGGFLSSIFTSPLMRAKETAEIVGRRLGVEVETVPGLEEMNFGICEGKTWIESKSLYPKELEEWEQNKRYRRISGGRVLPRCVESLLLRLLFDKEKTECIGCRCPKRGYLDYHTRRGHYVAFVLTGRLCYVGQLHSCASGECQSICL